MQQVNPEAAAKARAILKEKEDFRICLQEGICPKCGNKLSSRIVDNSSDCSNLVHTCHYKECLWTYKELI